MDELRWRELRWREPCCYEARRGCMPAMQEEPRSALDALVSDLQQQREEPRIALSPARVDLRVPCGVASSASRAAEQPEASCSTRPAGWASGVDLARPTQDRKTIGQRRVEPLRHRIKQQLGKEQILKI